MPDAATFACGLSCFRSRHWKRKPYQEDHFMTIKTKITSTLTALLLCLLSHGALAQDAVAVIYTTGGEIERLGTVTFTEMGDETVVEVRLRGLEPKSVHGFHIHEFGDIRAADGKRAGGHFAPEGHKHAGPTVKNRHAGDMGNLIVDANGLAYAKLTFKNFSLEPGAKDSAIGRAVVLHSGADDLKSQPSGDAGSRMAYGVIGLANPDQGK
jgi:superoxide dismutase, Cu-Zn family